MRVECIYKSVAGGAGEPFHLRFVPNGHQRAECRYRFVGLGDCWDARMAVGPAAVSRDLFFDIMEAYLKSDPKASDITVIPDAFAFRA